MPTSVLLSHAVITLNQAKRFLGIVDENLSQDDQSTIEELINAATEFLEDKLGRKIKTQTITDEVHSGRELDTYVRDGYVYTHSANYLKLRHFPMITVTGIKFDDVAVSDITDGTTTGYLYSAQDLKDNGLIFRVGGWPIGDRNIKISYTAGWSTVPYWIQEIAKEIVLFNYQKSQFANARNILINSSSDGTKSASGTPAYRTLEDIFSHFEKQLAPYMVRN